MIDIDHPLALDMRTILIAARRAFDAGTLQAQTTPDWRGMAPSCLYAGPCAIGAALSPEQQRSLDDVIAPELCTLIQREIVTFPTAAEGVDAVALQEAHDVVVATPLAERAEKLAAFEALLAGQEARYGLARPA